MNQYELRRQIDNANDEISYLQNQSARLQEKREYLLRECELVQREKEKEEQLFFSQRRKAEMITGTLWGRAATSFVEKMGQRYSAGKLAELFEIYDGIINNIRRNVEIADEQIEENNRRIHQLEGRIQSWKYEIRTVEKEERNHAANRK